MERRPRWTCLECGRKVSWKERSPELKICNRCDRRKQPLLYALKRVPEQYFQEEERRLVGE